MKKLIALITIATVLIFAGCSPDKETDKKSNETLNLQESETDNTKKETVKNNDIKVEEEPDVDFGTLDTSLFSDIGALPDGVAAIRGEVSESLWADGPLYRFGSSPNWYAFSQYEFGEEENMYIPLGECTQISISMNVLVKNAEVYSSKTLEHLTDTEFTQEYDEMGETNVYRINYNGYTLSIYADSKEDIGPNSVVNIKRE